METRKIIGFGKSTFAITLPRKWVLANKLKKGDTLALAERSGGKLEVFPSAREQQPEVRRITIPLADKPIKEVQRQFIAAYIKGFSVIDLVGPNEGKVSEFRRRLHELVAVEIMEVSPQRITVNVFFDVSVVSLPTIISRIELLTKNILQDTQALLRKSANLKLSYQEIMEKKREVDRQSLFAIRIIVNALTDPVFASKMESDPLTLSFVWHLIECMEKTSDYLIHIAFYLTSTNTLRALKKKAKEDLHAIFHSILDNYSLALKSYNKKSIPLANQVFDSHSKNDRQLYDYIYRNPQMWVPVITGYLRRTSSKSRDIAKITINLNTN